MTGLIQPCLQRPGPSGRNPGGVPARAPALPRTLPA